MLRGASNFGLFKIGDASNFGLFKLGGVSNFGLFKIGGTSNFGLSITYSSIYCLLMLIGLSNFLSILNMEALFSILFLKLSTLKLFFSSYLGDSDITSVGVKLRDSCEEFLGI